MLTGLEVISNWDPHLLAVAVGEGVSHLVDVPRRQLLVESSFRLLLQTLVEFSLGSKLEDEINTTLVIEISKQSEDVWVSQMGLDLYFSPEIIYRFKTIQSASPASP